MTTFGFDDSGERVPVVLPDLDADDHEVNATEEQLAEARHEGAERLLGWLASELERDLVTVPRERRRATIGSRAASLLAMLRKDTPEALAERLGVDVQSARRLLRKRRVSSR